jgi:hypothetical protein
MGKIRQWGTFMHIDAADGAPNDKECPTAASESAAQGAPFEMPGFDLFGPTNGVGTTRAR